MYIIKYGYCIYTHMSITIVLHQQDKKYFTCFCCFGGFGVAFLWIFFGSFLLLHRVFVVLVGITSQMPFCEIFLQDFLAGLSREKAIL